MKLLIHASGYLMSPWMHDERAEIRCVLDPRCGGDTSSHWSPATKDFAAAGVSSGGSSPAANVAELLKVIEGQQQESIEELRLIGHANSTVFALGGEIKKDDVYFTKEEAVIGDSPTFQAAVPKFRKLQDRLTANAKVILLGCNGGSGNKDLLTLLSHAFLRTAAGFVEEIKYTFDWGPLGPALKDKTGKTICFPLSVKPPSKVTKRGKMMYSTHGNDLAAVLGNASVTSLYTGNAWDLQPDASSNDSDVYIATRRKDPGVAATELAWRIIREFYKEHAWISGTSFDPAVPGLKVRLGDNKSVWLDVGSAYLTKTTPKTLKTRVAEMGQALDLVRKKKQGVIPAA
jgi:hypothetical protein